MTTQKHPEFPEKGINRYVIGYIRNLPNLAGKVVLDIPCGDGRASYEFAKKEATVKAYDLNPEFMRLPDIKAEVADLTDKLPVDSGSVDYIICQEGIEHLSDQLGMLSEFNRVLKKGGALLLTTPNNSHVRARLSHFLLESDIWRRMPPTELDSIWVVNKNSNKMYFGHLFLLGVQHLESLVTISGFNTTKRVTTNIGSTSLILGVVFYPIFIFFSFLAWIIYRKKLDHVKQQVVDQTFWSRLKLNLSPKTLFCKHIFWVLEKAYDTSEAAEKLKEVERFG